MTDRERLSPYHLVFGANAMDDTLFPPIAGEAEARDHPLDDPERFAFLTSVGRLIQAIAGEPATDDGGAAFRQHGRLIFHAFHFWRARKPSFALGADRVRALLDEGIESVDRGGPVRPGGPTDPGEPTDLRDQPGPGITPPAPAGYLQLPRNLVWAAAAPGDVPEPVDGFFWVHAEPAAREGALHLLMTLGVRPDRPGFSVVTATGMIDEASRWATMEGRPGARDFATTLPGGELDRLYSIETTAEFLKLAALSFLAVERSDG